MLNKTELEIMMKRNGDTGGSLADYLDISRGTFSNKINEKGAEFTKREIELIRDRYNLSGADLVAIFFAQGVS